ncbi:MAG: hypothetical protein HXL35_08060 [Prevotellaceae bacterium]|nr:hypothetical protein [Prevotellaceae bacterium]
MWFCLKVTVFTPVFSLFGGRHTYGVTAAECAVDNRHTMCMTAAER